MPPTTAPLTLAHLADQIHRASAGMARNAIVLVGRAHRDPVIDWWELPASVTHPSEALIGWTVGPHHDVVGIITSGTSRPHPSASSRTPPEGDRAVRLTHLVARDRATATVLAGAGGSTLIESPPEGLVADALRRTLGLTTPAPDISVGTLVEAGWLDAIAGVAFGGPERISSWSQLARLHPLAGADGVPSADDLARDVAELEAASSWRRLRHLAELRSPRVGRPPGGTETSPAAWFDDGSFARWATRNLPDPSELLGSLMTVLPLGVAAQLCRALTSVTLAEEADPPWWLDPEDLIDVYPPD